LSDGSTCMYGQASASKHKRCGHAVTTCQHVLDLFEQQVM